MKCDRCKQYSAGTIMSMFNMDTLCMPCKELEITHPKYQDAVDAEKEALSNGNMNYPGIGKPKDL